MTNDCNYVLYTIWYETMVMYFLLNGCRKFWINVGCVWNDGFVLSCI